jgi:hypothetical protein
MVHQSMLMTLVLGMALLAAQRLPRRPAAQAASTALSETGA